ncbi:Uncharacterised protein [Acholeplasma oculi]|uniref:Uncharacterized protein n=1 Tax=Acholeplasma oculi TaxID=35623 RepID=A0A061A8B3_9MOLU|nr:hypothetical protein [Acholeplasma oculi]CDR30140.1 hypothetical protein Aocu_00670 [Acholeplasma oculi]SKC44574.1 hypothetical protein SAMN02745122_1105 [Acholeplasma oculi]SUT88443.1 Uncharacterised protein [Acholeplasma oculi]
MKNPFVFAILRFLKHIGYITIIYLMIFSLIRFADLYNHNELSIDQIIQFSDLFNINRPIPLLVMTIIPVVLITQVESYVLLRNEANEKK